MDMERHSGHIYEDLEVWLAELRRRRDRGHEILWADHLGIDWGDWPNEKPKPWALMGFVDAADDSWHTITLMAANQKYETKPELRELFQTIEARDALLQPGV